jgi:predicted AlkP superfamily phosphohydrolase/phosphomutase
MVHVMETDSVQHQMWHTLDGLERPRYRARAAGNPVLEIYQRADALVGELLETCDEKTVVWVISDHGFGPHLYNLHLNTWLLQHGFLKLKRNAPTRAKRALLELGVVPENLYPWEERLRLLGRARGDQAYRWLSRFALSTQNIDWRRTVAYSYGNVGQIYLNQAGREPAGIVSGSAAQSVLRDLEAALLDWVNPWTGGPVIEKIYRREEIYGGRALGRTPELVFLPAEGHSPMGLSEFLSNRVITHPVAHSGWHRLEGVFLGAGGPLPSGGKLEGLKLIDLFPTICALLGAPVPDGIDGQIIEGLIERRDAENGVLAAQHAPGAHGSARPDGDDGALTQAEEEEILERLRGLGYL